MLGVSIASVAKLFQLKLRSAFTAGLGGPIVTRAAAGAAQDDLLTALEPGAAATTHLCAELFVGQGLFLH
jgi:hypothetical protein